MITKEQDTQNMLLEYQQHRTEQDLQAFYRRYQPRFQRRQKISMICKHIIIFFVAQAAAWILWYLFISNAWRH